MTDNFASQARQEDRATWVRLRTLILLRWLAITGQIVTIAVASQILELQLNYGLLYLAIGASFIANTIAMFIYPENKRLSENEAMLTLMFDVSQLAFLLYMTGGLNNPFALLILAPVTISAATLRLKSTMILGIMALALITIVGFYHVPLRTAEGFILRMPDILAFGFWMAIVIGVLFLGAYAYRVTGETHSMSEALLATQMALAREQKLTDLGGVIAAAAHELGTPLATIKLVSQELSEELDDPILREDAELIRDQADRCRDILRDMGRAGKDDLHLKTAPLSAIVREAADPHSQRGKSLHFDISPAPGGGNEQPTIRRQPEIIHGLRNFVQNAVDFAEANVWIDVHWTDEVILIRIIDDGEGYPTHLLGRIGDPFVRKRRSPADPRRPGYEGMGLGLFIAKTLLERTGAELSFANGSDPFLPKEERPVRSGAIVEAIWPREGMAEPQEDQRPALGENQRIEA
ncbi:sensor histidine kinase RegB [Tropicimonas sp. S265A]|uniref:sensor histidine kinase RegB n=1 Tax=Tropicimonas sp. S265A TaxID=3415134 RepID=UPI003C7A9C19